jgi:hypothetical protein
VPTAPEFFNDPRRRRSTRTDVQQRAARSHDSIGFAWNDGPDCFRFLRDEADVTFRKAEP